MHSIIIISPDELIKSSLRISLRQLDEVDLRFVDDIDQYHTEFKQRKPSMVISEFNLPEKSPLEIFNYTQESNTLIPVVLLVTYLSTCHASLRTHPYIDFLEKPVKSSFLKNLVMSRINSAVINPEVKNFHPSDIIQMSAFGRHSHVISVYQKRHLIGEIVINYGLVWSAKDTDGYGVNAFRRLMSISSHNLICQSHTLDHNPSHRNIFDSWHNILRIAIEARSQKETQFDENLSINEGYIISPMKKNEHNGDHLMYGEFIFNQIRMDFDKKFGSQIAIRDEDRISNSNNTYAFISKPKLELDLYQSHSNDDDNLYFDDLKLSRNNLLSRPLTTEYKERRSTQIESEQNFDHVFEQGVDALLNRDYSKAWIYFQAAIRAKPGHGRVLANLNRLKELGFGESSS